MRFTPLGKLLLVLIGASLVGTVVYRAVPSVRRSVGEMLGRTDTVSVKAPEGGPGGSAGSARATGQSEAAVRLRLHGSNTIGRDLAPALAEKFLAREGAVDVRRVPRAEDEVLVVGRLPGQEQPVAIEIEAHGTGTAFEGLSRGEADIGLASRRVKPEERLSLAALGDLTAPASEHVLGLDGVAILVHRSNPVDALSLDGLRDLFSGRISDWSQVGGTPGPVTIYARDDRSGTYDTFKNLVLGDATLAAGSQRYEDSRRLAADLARDPRGIGFAGLAYVGDAKALKISDAGSVAYRPTVFTVRTEDYRLSRRLYLYTAATPANPWISGFVSFALSDAGQAVVDAIGFVGQSLANPVAGGSPLPGESIPPAYARWTAGATRLPLGYRFESGSDRLDNKALRDIGRLVESLSQPERRGRTVLLFGFADSLGGEATNVRLSRRAEALAVELRAEGVEPQLIEGFGSALPVASNSTEEGRGRNRRVEVWLR